MNDDLLKDLESLSNNLVMNLSHHELCLAVAESCSGGLLSSYITSVSGSSQVFAGGIISYSNEVKHTTLAVPESILNIQGAVSSRTAEIMAEGILKVWNAVDISASITGVAGPEKSEGKPVGLVYIAIAQRQRKTISHAYNFKGNRQKIRLLSVQQALNNIIKSLPSMQKQ